MKEIEFEIVSILIDKSLERYKQYKQTYTVTNHDVGVFLSLESIKERGKRELNIEKKTAEGMVKESPWLVTEDRKETFIPKES